MLEPMFNPDPTTSKSSAEEARARALALLEKGLFPEAVREYDVSLEAADQTGDPAFRDWIYVCRAGAVAECSPAGAELLELKQILLRAQDPQTSFRAAYTSSRIYELRRDFKKAIFYNGIARRHAQTLNDVSLAGHAENQLGNLLTADSSFAQAAEAYTRALATVKGVPGFPEIYLTVWRENLGYCLLAEGRLADGLSMVHECLEILENKGAVSFTLVPLMDLCYGYLMADRYEEAILFGEKGLSMTEASADPSIEKNLLYLLGEACHLSGNTHDAQHYFDRLAGLYPEFRNLRAYLDVFDFRNVINLRA